MKAKPVELNDAFRQWTSGQSFALVMGRAQIAVLVSIHASQDRLGRFGCVGSGHPRLKHWITGVRGLEERGLVRHSVRTIEKERFQRNRYTMREVWPITEAGAHVVELLRIAGIYGVLLREFEAQDERTHREQMAGGYR